MKFYAFSQLFVLLLFTQPTILANDYVIQWPEPMARPLTPDYWKFQNTKRLVDYFAERYKIDKDHWYTLIELESGWDRFAVSKKHASGICQVWPPTARGYGLKGNRDQIVELLKNPAINIPLCARLLRNLLRRYNGDWFNVAVAFNAGPGVVTYAQKISQSRQAVSRMRNDPK